MQILTTAVIKGGTGKTSTAAAIAQAAAKDEKKVLAVDMDAQANLSLFLGGDPTLPTAFDLLTGKTDTKGAIQRTEQGLNLIGGHPDLAGLTTARGSARRLADALDPIKKDYDLIIIDTPPQMGEATYSALMAATDLLIPLETDQSSIQGLFHIAEVAEQIREANPALTIRGTVVTRFDGRPNLNRYLLDGIRDAGAEIGAPFLMAIRAGVAIREAQAMQLSLYDYAPRSNPAKDYKELYRLICD